MAEANGLAEIALSFPHSDAPRPWTTAGQAAPPPDDALGAFRRAVDGFCALEHHRGPATELLHETTAALHTFAATVSRCEQAGFTHRELRPYLDHLRTRLGLSPLIARLQEWPLGYAGDYETVEWLCEGLNRAQAGTLHWAVEQCSLHSPIAQQHRNKVGLQARAVLSTLMKNPAARIASVGCGGCRDLSLIQEFVAPTHGEFVLVDADADALAFARRRLPLLEDRCTFIRGRVPRALSQLRGQGGFDLVVAGGLFDYLPDRWAVATLVQMRRLLKAGGRLLLSNIASGNPFRPWIEYLADWKLIERQEADVVGLLQDSGFLETHTHLFRDSSGLALMIEATRIS